MTLKFNKKIEIDFSITPFQTAKELSSLDSGEQAEFFNVFFEELRKRCGNLFCMDMQMISISEKLTRQAKGCFIFLNQSQNKKKDKIK